MDYISIARDNLGADVHGNLSHEYTVQSKSNVAVIITINHSIIYCSFNGVLQDITKYKDFDECVLVFCRFIDA